MRNNLCVDGTDLATFGVYVSGGGTFSAPEKEFTWYDIPARNGSVLGYERRLQNIQVSYDCFIYASFDTNIANLRSFLLSRDGLVRIADTYHPTEFRMGVYSGPFEPSVERTLDAGRFTLTFVCLPQRWLTSGETYTTITRPASGTATTGFTNPTRFDALPIMRVYGAGAFQIGQYTLTMDASAPASIASLGYWVDCEKMTVKTNITGGTSLSQYFSITLGGQQAPTFPKLAPGSTGVVLDSTQNVTQIKFAPRWWTV